MTRARFVAGAVCGLCGALDRIVIEDASNGRVQRCVVCGDNQSMKDAQSTDESIIRVRSTSEARGRDK